MVLETNEQEPGETAGIYDGAARRITGLRKEKGYSKLELAKKAGIARVTLIHMEQGYGANVEAYVKIAECLDVSLDYLMRGIPKPDLKCEVTELLERLKTFREHLGSSDDENV